MKRLSPSVDTEDGVDGAKYETHTRARALVQVESVTSVDALSA